MDLLPEHFNTDFSKLHDSLRSVDLLRPNGAVVRVTGLTLESNGPQVGLGEMCSISLNNGNNVMAEAIGFRGGNIILLPLENIDGVCPGNTVSTTEKKRLLPLDNSILGRVIDGLGRPIDGKGPLAATHLRPIENDSPTPLEREKISLPLPLGIKAIDGLLTLGKGQRVGIFAGSGVGKSVLLGDIAKGSSAQVNVVVLVGERGREVREFLEENLGPEGLARSVVVVATSDSTAIQRVKAGSVGATVAEFFRDQGLDVLFMMDSLTRFAQAQREIGLAAGEPPASKGYCPSVFAKMPKLVERLGNSDKGTITGILTVLAEGDDMNDPVADSARSLLDGHIVLSRKLAAKSHFPAIDILSSVSRLMNTVANADHKTAANSIREIYATYADAEDLINIGAFAPGSNKRIDGAIALIDNLYGFLRQEIGASCEFEETKSIMNNLSAHWRDHLIEPMPIGS